MITGCEPARSKPLTWARKRANQLLAAERAFCEDAFAHLKNRRGSTRLRRRQSTKRVGRQGLPYRLNR